MVCVGIDVAKMPNGGDKVATLHPIQINSLTEYTEDLQMAHDIISSEPAQRSDILYLMECLVECRTNLNPSCRDPEWQTVLWVPLFYIKHLRNQ